jgi:hypothetical protein
MYECPFCNFACDNQLEFLEHYEGCAEEHALREKTIQTEIDRLIKEKESLTTEKEFFEKNIKERN